MCAAFGPIYILFGLNKSTIEKSLKERNCDFNVKSTLIAAKFFDKQIIWTRKPYQKDSFVVNPLKG